MRVWHWALNGFSFLCLLHTFCKLVFFVKGLELCIIEEGLFFIDIRWACW